MEEIFKIYVHSVIGRREICGSFIEKFTLIQYKDVFIKLEFWNYIEVFSGKIVQLCKSR
jgi:hypothetical protein